MLKKIKVLARLRKRLISHDKQYTELNVIMNYLNMLIFSVGDIIPRKIAYQRAKYALNNYKKKDNFY